MSSDGSQFFLYFMYEIQCHTIFSQNELCCDRALSHKCCAERRIYRFVAQAFFLLFYGFYDTTGRSHIRYTVDKDQLAQCFMFFELICNDTVRKCDLAESDLIFL